MATGARFSKRRLYEVLETETPMADMGHLLQEQLESLRKLLETFVKPTPQGTTAIESGTATLHGKPTPLIGPQEKAFVLRLSGHLDVDAVCCFELLRDTVRYELQHPSVSPSFYGQGGKGLTYGDELLEAVTGYYLADREALLLLVESIIKAAQDPQHMHHDPCQEILSTLLQKHSLEQTLHTQLKAALAAPVPKRFQGNPKYAALWATHLLKEQRGLLQILIMLYYEQVSCTGSSVATLMETLAASRFGNDQMNGSYFDESAEPLLGQISHQVLVLCTEMLNLEELLGGDAIESLGELPGGTLLQSPALLESVNALFWKGLYRPVDSRPAYRNSGPLAILWATFTQRVVSLLEVSCPPGYEDIFKKWSEPNAQGQFVPQLLLQNAFTDLGGFQGLLKDLESHIYESSFGSYLLAYGSILKGFLSLFVVTQNVSTLPNRHILVSCFARLFASSEDLAVQFWEQDYPLPERRSLLDTTRRAFPIEFHPFIELLKALSSGTKSAQYTLRYMEQLPTCTTLFDETHYILPGLSRSQTKAFWKAGHLVHGSSSLLISPPRGATGHFVARDIILLEFPYSGIHLLLSLIDSFLSAHAYDSSFMDEQIICVSGTKETVSDALLFLGSLLEKMDAQAIHRLMAHLSKLRGVPKDSVPEFVVGLLTKILDRCANFPTPAFTLISYTLKVMSSLLRVYPNIVWRHLRARNFLPKYTLSAFSQGTYASSSSYVQSTLLPAERTQGRYQITLMFLKLVHDLVADAQLLRQPGSENSSAESDTWFGERRWVMAEVLYSCLVFINTELFSSYASWRYERIQDRLDIGHSIMTIYNLILGDSTWTKSLNDMSSSMTELSDVRDYLFESYLSGRQGYYLNAFLDLISTGNEMPLMFYKRHQIKEAFCVEQTIISALDFLERLVSIRVFQKRPISACELTIMQRSVEGSGRGADVIQTIGRYVNYEFNPSIPLKATQVLTMIATVAHESEAPLPSFVGYFGDEARHIVSSMILLLKDDLAIVNNDLQTGIYSCIAVIMSTQPGLASIFLTKDIQKPSETLNFKGTLLEIVLDSLSDWKKHITSNLTTFVAMLKVLVVLWHNSAQHRKIVSKLASTESLWKSLLDLQRHVESQASSEIETEVSFYWDLIKAHIMSLVALCLHSCKSLESQGLKVPKDVVQIVRSILKQSKDGRIPLFSDNAPAPYLPELESWLTSQSEKISTPIDPSVLRVPSWNDEINRQYGRQYIYDADLFSTKFGIHVDLLEQEQLFVDGLHAVNLNLSSMDAFLVKVRAWKSLVETVASHSSEVIGSKDNPLNLDANDQVLNIVSSVFHGLQQDSKEGYLMVTYRDELCEMAFFLLGRVLQVPQIPSAMMTSLICLLAPIEDCMRVDIFRLGPAGYFSAYRFQLDLLSASMLIMRAFEKHRKVASSNVNRSSLVKVDEAISGLAPIVISGIGFLLQGFLSDSGETRLADLQRLLVMLSEMSLPLSRVSPTAWVSHIEREQLIELLSNAFARASLQDLQQSESHITEQVLEVFLAFSRHPITAELLAVHGIMACFSNNFFSQALIEGSLEPYCDSERRKEHNLWCLQLSIVSNLLLNLGHSSHFLEEVYGFVRLYQNQVIRSLCIMSEYSLSFGSLEECSRVAELFYGLARSTDAQGSSSSDVLTGYQDFAVRLLSNAIYLFKSPVELKRTSQPMSSAEKSLMVPLSDSKDVLKMSSKTKFSLTMERMLLRLSISLLAHFRWTTQADMILKSQIPATDMSRSIFQITMQSQSVQGCSVGSLLDGVRYFISYLTRQVDEDFEALQLPPANILGFAAETCLTLITTQLALNLCTDDLEPSIVREMRDETFQSIQDYSNVLNKATTKESIGKMVPGWTALTLKQAKDRVALLESFGQRLMF